MRWFFEKITKTGKPLIELSKRKKSFKSIQLEMKNNVITDSNKILRL